MSEETAKEGFRRLAFGSSKDAVRLLFCDEAPPQKLGHMDLFTVSEIRRDKDGGVAIKFYDRMEALTRLSELENTGRGAEGFLRAIEDGAAALRKKETG